MSSKETAFKIVQKKDVITIFKDREKIVDWVNHKFILANESYFKLQKKVHITEYDPWLKALKTTRKMLNIKKQVVQSSRYCLLYK